MCALEVTYDLNVRQLNLLIDLQKAMQKYGRLNVQYQLNLINDELYAENGNRPADPEIDEQIRLIGVEVNLLNSQIQSDHIRQKVIEAMPTDSWSNDPMVINKFMHDTVSKITIAIEAVDKEVRAIERSLAKVFSQK